ncbi:HNH endonuclease [Pelistega ratti]|uniref:HNH endonuclease n=1 Tax=Pelistega ratti TaxID=2652177 RepID=UPI00135B0437|nr:HNH endonuclease signature motif containing protein [Pelistega ratti]
MQRISWREDKTKVASRGYGGKWQRLRLAFLKKNPLCVYCERQGKVTEAKVVDHIVPHQGDQKLFWDQKNWQALCKSCHSSVKQREETGSLQKGCDVNGIPLDPNHHWNKKV